MDRLIQKIASEGPTLKGWCLVVSSGLTAPIWVPLMLLWFALRLTYESLEDLIFRFRYRKEFAKMPKGPSEPRYCMRVECADGTEMHFQLSKPPKNAWVRDIQTDVYN
jgi:hypothetical protein